MTAVHTKLRLLQVKLKNIIPGENISRAGKEHTERSVRNLADQIVLNDYWTPPDVVVAPSHRSEENQKYLLIAGYKRIAAANLLSLEGRLPAVAGDKNGVYVYIHSKTDAQRDAINAAENIVRENLSNYQKAHTLLQLQERHAYSNKHLAESSGIDMKSVANYIRAAKKLIPQIQMAWMNFDDSPNPISLNKLYAWAALDPEEQARQFEASVWAHIYEKAEESKPKTSMRPLSIRPRNEIETAIASTGNLYHIEALEWVLRKRDTLDGERIASASRHDRGSSKRKRADLSSSAVDYDGTSLDESSSGPASDPTRPPRDRSGKTLNRSSDSLRENERGKPNGTPNTS